MRARPCRATRGRRHATPPEREFFIDNLLVRIHFIIVMIRWTGLAPWEFESPFPGSLTSTLLDAEGGEDAWLCAELDSIVTRLRACTLNPAP